MGVIGCVYKPLEVEAVEVTESNFKEICDFVDGHHPQMADNPTMPRGKYLGVFIETRYGRQLARLGEYVVKVGAMDYRTYTRDEFVRTFNLKIKKQ